jgi:hypothetical protein
MQIILLILTIILGLSAYLLYPRFPRMMRLLTALFLLLCVGTISAIIFSPRNLEENIPSYFTTITHPWILVLVGVSSGALFMSCAIGSLVACWTTKANRKIQGKQDAVSNGG